MTNDPDISAAKSIVDYIFRWMGKKFLTVDQQEEIGILSAEVRGAPSGGLSQRGDAPAGPARVRSCIRSGCSFARPDPGSLTPGLHVANVR
jgi:hypothetical protein